MGSERQTVQLPAAFLAILLLSFPVGIVVAASTDSWAWARVGLLAPFFISLGIWRTWQRLRPTTTAKDSQVTSSQVASATVRKPYTLGEVWLLGFGSLFSGLAVVVGGTYLRQFWFVAIAGLLATIGFWNQRDADNLRGALAFIGIFVSMYGILGVVVQVLAR